jgi:asparagine synthase (glutamine-hydrolysing)
VCGIAGIVGVERHPRALESMARAMVHRGPDHDGFYSDDSNPAGLAFTRLAIVDLDGGNQPMQSEDGGLQVVFNGEIYDHLLLRADLESRGHRFVSDHSDTEILVHGWEEWGPDLFVKLNGMFAVAIWEPSARRLVLARDRYGIKPLYYALVQGSGIVFASEIKAIHRSSLVPARPSASGIREYFAFQNVWREPTMFDAIRQLSPGTMLVWKDGDISRRRYWDLAFPRSRSGSIAALADEHREILRRVVRRQIAADVPVMSYLSGGIDSTAITVASHQVDSDITAYSCIFDLSDVDSDRAVDEREFSRVVARTYDLRRVEHLLQPDALIDSLHPYVRALEDLRMGMGYPVYLIAARVAEDARVVLSGTGGDEFHGGYVGRYASLGLTNGHRTGVTARLLSLFGRGAEDDRTVESGYRRTLNFLVPQAESSTFFTEDFLNQTADFDANAIISDVLAACPSSDWRNRILYVDAKTYLAGLLALEDKLSMAHSLETRVPLLDNELVDFMLDVPFDALWQADTGKVLFRESVRPWVPDAIFSKPKMGFGPPDASWYRGPLRPWIEQTLANERIRALGVVRPETVRAILSDHFSGSRDATYQIWSLLNFVAWCDEFGFYAVS